MQRAFEKKRARGVRVLELVRASVNETTSLGRIGAQTDSTPFRVLISTMLSARTRDPVTEQASARLFQRYKDARALSKAKKTDVKKLIRQVNFYETKTRRIIEVAKIIDRKYFGRVPENVDELLLLPGVGRKTANCVLVYAFRKPAIPVDVHVHRISNRIGLVETVSPEQTEIQLARIYNQKYWLAVNELFVKFGQTICRPLAPRCSICSVRSLCNYYQNQVKSKKRVASS
ncbi:MAG: endonuclease III domain-containing protein [Nitrososphaerales archaeon]